MESLFHVLLLKDLLKILYNWYFLQAFNFCYFHDAHDSTKISILENEYPALYLLSLSA